MSTLTKKKTTRNYEEKLTSLATNTRENYKQISTSNQKIVLIIRCTYKILKNFCEKINYNSLIMLIFYSDIY